MRTTLTPVVFATRLPGESPGQMPFLIQASGTTVVRCQLICSGATMVLWSRPCDTSLHCSAQWTQLSKGWVSSARAAVACQSVPSARTATVWCAATTPGFQTTMARSSTGPTAAMTPPSL
jgi:hypothetical protein